MIISPENFKFSCNCNKEHIVTLKTAVIEANAVSKFDETRKLFGYDGFCTAIYDENTYKATENRHPNTDSEIILNPIDLHADEKAVNSVLNQLDKDTKVLAAVGSGTIHDIVRYVAAKLNLPFISIPTAASVDGFVSTVAAMTWGGYKVTMPAAAPEFLLADLDIIVNAPFNLMKSGVGDILGKYTSLADWEIGHVITGEYYCDEIAGLMKKAVNEILNSYKELKNKNYKAYENLTYALVLSGIAMQLSQNSRPASGTEHHISHMLELELDTFGKCSHLHGEKVGVGTLISIEKYKKWTGVKDFIFAYPKEWNTENNWFNENEIIKIFGDKAKDVFTENKNNCALEINEENIRENWDKIINIIENIPSYGQIMDIYEFLDAKRTLNDIDICEDLKDEIFYWSPYIRNRLTFSRITHYIKPI